MLSLLDSFLRLTSQSPDADALILYDGEESSSISKLSRVELLALADSIIAATEGLLSPIGAPVVLCFHATTAGSVAGMLASLYAEQPFLPIDASEPSTRWSWVLDNLSCMVILCNTESEKVARVLANDTERLIINTDYLSLCNTERSIDELLKEWTTRPLPNDGKGPRITKYAINAATTLRAANKDCMYIMHTSGSTGTPKFVRCTGSGTLNRCDWAARLHPWAEGKDVCIAKTSLSFVDHIAEVFAPLRAGVALVVSAASRKERFGGCGSSGTGAVLNWRDTTQLVEACRRCRVTRMVVTPSLLRELLRLGAFEGAPEEESHNVAEKERGPQQTRGGESQTFALGAAPLADLQFAHCSGEPLSWSLAEAVVEAARPGFKLLNLYGSTECAATDAGADVACFTFTSASISAQINATPDGSISPSCASSPRWRSFMPSRLAPSPLAPSMYKISSVPIGTVLPNATVLLLKRLDASHGCGSIWESNCDRGDFEEYEAADNSDFSVAKKKIQRAHPPQLWIESCDEGEVFVGGVQPVGGYIGDEWDVATGSFVYLREVSSPSPSSKSRIFLEDDSTCDTGTSVQENYKEEHRNGGSQSRSRIPKPKRIFEEYTAGESALGVAGEEFVLQKFLRMADIGKYISVAAPGLGDSSLTTTMNIALQGRIDHIVKVRGKKVSLLEVENCCREKLPQASDSIALTIRTDNSHGVDHRFHDVNIRSAKEPSDKCVDSHENILVAVLRWPSKSSSNEGENEEGARIANGAAAITSRSVARCISCYGSQELSATCGLILMCAECTGRAKTILSTCLPSGSVPSSFFLVKHFPKILSGKVDRKRVHGMISGFYQNSVKRSVPSAQVDARNNLGGQDKAVTDSTVSSRSQEGVHVPPFPPHSILSKNKESSSGPSGDEDWAQWIADLFSFVLAIPRGLHASPMFSASVSTLDDDQSPHVSNFGDDKGHDDNHCDRLDSNFYALGGDSMSALRLLSLVGSEAQKQGLPGWRGGQRQPLLLGFEARPTPKALAAFLLRGVKFESSSSPEDAPIFSTESVPSVQSSSVMTSSTPMPSAIGRDEALLGFQVEKLQPQDLAETCALAASEFIHREPIMAALLARAEWTSNHCCPLSQLQVESRFRRSLLRWQRRLLADEKEGVFSFVCKEVKSGSIVGFTFAHNIAHTSALSSHNDERRNHSTIKGTFGRCLDSMVNCLLELRNGISYLDPAHKLYDALIKEWNCTHLNTFGQGEWLYINMSGSHHSVRNGGVVVKLCEAAAIREAAKRGYRVVCTINTSPVTRLVSSELRFKARVGTNSFHSLFHNENNKQKRRIMACISCYSSKQFDASILDEQHEIVLYDRFLQRRGDRFEVLMIPLAEASTKVQRSIDEVMQECFRFRWPTDILREMRHLQNRDGIAIVVVERNSTGRYQNSELKSQRFQVENANMPTVSKGRLAGAALVVRHSRCVAELLLLGVLPEFRMLGLSERLLRGVEEALLAPRYFEVSLTEEMQSPGTRDGCSRGGISSDNTTVVYLYALKRLCGMYERRGWRKVAYNESETTTQSAAANEKSLAIHTRNGGNCDETCSTTSSLDPEFELKVETGEKKGKRATLRDDASLKTFLKLRLADERAEERAVPVRWKGFLMSKQIYSTWNICAYEYDAVKAEVPNARAWDYADGHWGV